MSLEYIRQQYSVPAGRGVRVRYMGKPGTITGSRNQYLRIRLDGDTFSALYHPTYEIEYLPGEKTEAAEKALREAVRTPLTETEIRAIKAIANCTYLPGSFEKRFARDMACLIDSGKGITDKQRDWLWKQTYRYRRQIGSTDLIRLAKSKSEPPPPLQAVSE